MPEESKMSVHRHSSWNWTSVILKREVHRRPVPFCPSSSMKTVSFTSCLSSGLTSWTAITGLTDLRVSLLYPLLYLFPFLPLPLSLSYHSHQPPPWQIPLPSHLPKFSLVCPPFLYAVQFKPSYPHTHSLWDSHMTRRPCLPQHSCIHRWGWPRTPDFPTSYVHHHAQL